MNNPRVFALVLSLALVIGVGACGSSNRLVRFASNPEVPAAQGEIKLGVSENGNTTIDMKVQHLAPPERVTPGASVYMVWARPLDPGANVVSLGALVVNEKLEGELATVTPMREFDLFITPESSRTPDGPTGKEVLTARVQMGRRK